MSSNSITHFISTAKDLSDLLYIEKFFEKHSLTPLSLENCIVNDLERLFESVLNTPIPNSEHMKGLLGIIKCLRQISLCKGDEQWLILYERVSTLISKCTRYIMTHLDVDNTLFSEILQLILQIIIDSSRHHISIKNKMLQCLSPLIFDIIVNKKPPLALEKLCIQSLSLLVTRTDQERRKEVMELVYPKLAKFFDHLYTCGDYDTQLCIVETILRFIVPDKNRKMFFVNFKHKNPNVIRNFLNVRSKDFDTDCRIFLNYVNRSQGENALVISIPCYTVLLNETIIEKPPEQELFWVDFNRGALSVSIWCNKNSLLTPEERAIPDFVSSTDWQLLTIKPEVVTEVKVKSIKPCDEVQRNFIEIQFIINRPLEIRPLEEIMCTQSRSVSILFPRSKETEALEHKVLSSIFKMRKLDGMCKQNKVNDESDRRNKCISSAKVHLVGMVNSSSFNNISRMPFSKEERCQKLKETDENVTKERSKSWASGRKISTTKTNIEFQSFLDSDEEKEDSPRKTSTKQVSDISDSELNHRTARHSERVDEAKSSVAGRSLLDNNQEENNEEIARNQHNVEEKEDNQKIIKTNTNMHLNSTKPKTRYAKMSTTVEKCNFFERIPENCRTSMSFHSDNKSLNSNSYLRIGQSPPEIHASTKDATDISHKNLSKEELRTEVINGKIKQNLNANYVENLSEKGIRESKTEFRSHKENVKVSRSINTCQLNVPGHKISFSSSNQNLINPLSKKNAKEIDVSTATSVNNTENRIEERTIKISESSKISDKELNHRKTRHSEGVDEAKSSVAGRSLLDNNVNQEENNEEIARNQHNVEEKEDNQNIIKTNTNMHLNSTKPKTRYAKMSTTVEKCNFFERIPENDHSMSVHSDNESLNSNNNLRIAQSTPEMHASTKDATDISHKNLSKEELRTEVVNEKMKQNLNANYVENLSEKGIRESKTECKSHKENVKVSRSINTCQLNVPGHKISFSSSNQNLINPLSKKNAKEIDVLAATIVNNTENRIEERRTIKISTSADKCTFKLKKGEKKDIFPQSLNKTISSSESRKVNHLLQPNNTEDQQTSKYQDCNVKMNDLNEFPIESKNSENNDKKTRRVSNSCLFESMEKNTVTQDALNHTDILPNEISTDKMMSKVNINDENVDDNKSKEAKNVTHVDLNHEFHNSEKKIETNSLSPNNAMTEDKKFTKTDEVIPYTENRKINVKGTSRTTCFDSSKEFLNSKIKERVSDLLPSTKSRFFKTSECSQKQSLQTNTANKIKNERSTEQTVARSRKQSQFNSEKGASDFTPARRRSKRIQSARRQSENIFKSSALNTSRKRDEKQDSDNDFDEKKHFENISMKRLQTTRKEKLRKDFVDAPCISDKYIDRNRQEVMDTGIANKVQFEGTHFRRKLKKDNADCVINKIQDMNVSLSGKRNVCENLCKSPQDKKTEIKFVSKHENNNQESNCKLLVTETPSPILVENCINQSNEETTNTMKTSRFLISEIISVNEENNHNTEEERKHHLKVKHSIGKTQSQSRSLKKYRKPTELCEAEACESSFQTCSLGTEVTEGAEVNGHNLVHNNSENNDNNNSKCLQEREKDINLSNELSHAECVNLIVDCKEIYTENRGSDSETVINIEGKSQDVFVHNEVQENPNSENNVNNSKNNKESDTKEGSAQLSCSQSDVSHIVTNAIVHNSSQSSSPIDNQYIEKSGVDTVITHSVKVFKFFTQNITSVENKNNDSFYFQDENKTNTTKHIVNASVKDSVEKVYIQETVTSKKQSTDCGKKGKAAETHCEDSNEKNKVNKINEGTCASIKKGKTENFKTINSSRKKKNLHPVSRSEIKPVTTRALRKRKAVSYTYNSPVYTQEEKGKGEVNHCSHNKVGRSSVKKRLFTQNEVDIVSLCSGSQNSCLTENGIQEVNIKEIPLDTKKCDPSKSQNNSHDEFDKLLITSPPPLPIRNPNHWKEKYRKDIQMMSLKQTSSNQKIVNSKKTKHSVYSDLDSSSDMSVFFDNADHERKAIAVEDSEKTNFVSLIKIKNTVSEINSKSKDPQSEEKNALFHLNPNNSNDTLHINNTILSPKVSLNKPPSSIEEERNSKVNSINPQKNADEVVMDKEKQGFQQDAEPFVKNSIMDVEPEKVKMRHSKIQIKSENNKEIDCNSKNKKGEQIIQQGNSEKLVYMMSICNNKRITTQTGKSINNEGCSKQLQEHNVNCSLAETAVYQVTNSENKLNEVSSVQQNKEAQNKVENIKFNESIHESNQKDLCKKKRKLIVYSDTDSDCNVSVSAPKEKYQNEETYTAKLQIKKSNEYFSENENKGFETNATNRDTSRNVNSCLNPKDSIERLQTNELTLQLTSEEITDQPEILVNNIEYSKQLQLEKGNNCITTDHVTQNIGCNDEMSKFAVQQNNEVQLQSRKEIVKHCSVNAKTQGHEQAEYFIEEKIKNNINKRRKHVSRGQNKQKGSSAFQCNENCTNKSTHYETKCNTLNKIDRIPTCREQELQISLMHSMNEKENSNEINDKYVNDAETVKDQRIIEQTPLKCIDTFENKRKKHRNFQKLIKNNEISPLFLKNRHYNKKFLNIDNYNSQTLINKEYLQGTDSQIGYKNSIKKTAANCSKENVRSGNVLLNGSKTLNKDNRRIRNTKELSERQKVVGSHIYRNFHTLQPKGQLEINGKLNTDDNVSTEENGLSNQETHFCAVSSIKSNEIVKRQSKGQIQSKKSTSKVGYEMHKNHIEHRFLQKPLVCKWNSETDGSSLSSPETTNEFSEEQSTSVRKIKRRKLKTSFLKKEFQKSTRGKKKCIKEFSCNISNSLLGHFSQSSHIFHARRTDSRKHLDNNVGHKIVKIKNSIQTLDSFIESMEERIAEVNGMVMNQNYIEEDIKQNFIHIENEYMKFAADLSNEPKFDVQHLISSLGEKFRKETLRNMLKKLHNVYDTSL